MSERIYQVIIGVLVLVVLVGGWLMIASKRAKTSIIMDTQTAASAAPSTDSDSAADTDAASATSKQTSQNTTVASGEAVSVLDQEAGKTVKVASVTLEKRGWIAVQDDKEWTLGAQRLEAGAQKDVTVTLLRATEKGETYKVVVYVDNGNGTFDLHKDTLVTKADGSVLSAAFIAK